MYPTKAPLDPQAIDPRASPYPASVDPRFLQDPRGYDPRMIDPRFGGGNAQPNALPQFYPGYGDRDRYGSGGYGGYDRYPRQFQPFTNQQFNNNYPTHTPPGDCSKFQVSYRPTQDYQTMPSSQVCPTCQTNYTTEPRESFRKMLYPEKVNSLVDDNLLDRRMSTLDPASRQQILASLLRPSERPMYGNDHDRYYPCINNNNCKLYR
ncbi:Hypothetical protein MVR_LOCUS128 [uncultured virus]|nr:Hypothetical protein MVR_LOCUS128 [uncultured virus]